MFVQEAICMQCFTSTCYVKNGEYLSCTRTYNVDNLYPICSMTTVVSLVHQTPQSKGKEGSGDHVYSESFSWNTIIVKDVTDNCKNGMASHTCVRRKQGVAWQ